MYQPRTKFLPVRALVVLCAALVFLSACSDDEGGEAEPVADITEFLTNAADFRDKGQFQSAMIETRNAIQAAPQDVRPYREMAKTLLEIGQQRQAIRTLEDIPELDAESSLVLVRAYLEVGKVRSADELLNAEKLAGLRDSTQYRHLQARINFVQRDYQAAIDQFEELIVEEPNNADHHLGLINALLGQSEIAAARDKLNELLSMDSQNSEALLILSRLEQQAGDLAAEEQYLTQAIGSLPTTDIITPLRYSILVGLRDNLTKQGKTSEALLYSGLVSESIPGADLNQQQIQAAVELVQSGDYEEARAQLEELISRVPGSEQAVTLLALIDYLQGDDEAASIKFANVIDPETSSPVALQIFAVTELRLNQPEKVIERLSKDIDASNDSKLNALYAVALASSGREAESEHYFKKSIEWDPDNGRLYLPLARLYNQLERTEEALATVQTAFKKQPEEPLVQRSLIAQQLSMNLVDAAAKTVENITSNFPADPNAWLLAANFHLQQGDFDAGDKALIRALDLGPSLIAEHQRARIKLQQEDHDGAIAAYRTLLTKDAEDSNAYKGLITAYELKEQGDKGVDELKTMFADNKSNALALVLSEYFGRNGELEQAEYWLGQYSGDPSEQSTRLSESLIISQARASLADGGTEEGFQILTAGLEKYPGSSRILASLITLKITDKQLDEAGGYLEQLRNLSEEPVVNILTGDLEVARGNLLPAMEAYRSAWQQSPIDQTGFKLFSTLQTAKRPPEEITAFLEEWYSTLPSSDVAGITRAGFYYSMGNLDIAKQGYEELIERNANNVIALNNLAWIYSEDEADKALAAGEAAYNLAPNRPEIMDTYGWFLYKNGKADEAVAILREAVKLAPDNAEIVEHLEEAESAQ